MVSIDRPKPQTPAEIAANGCNQCDRDRDRYRDELVDDFLRCRDVSDIDQCYFERDKDGNRLHKKQWRCSLCKQDCGWSYTQFRALFGQIRADPQHQAGRDVDWEILQEARRVKRAGRDIPPPYFP